MRSVKPVSGQTFGFWGIGIFLLSEGTEINVEHSEEHNYPPSLINFWIMLKAHLK